jgi:3',5'-cyclic AMP phosphodiesterase CpdA
MKTLAHISDLHFGRIDRRVVEGLMADLIRTAPDLVVISGDLVQRARLSHFRAARAFLEALPFPYLVVPGNHDIPVFNLFKRFTDPYRLYRRHVSHDLSPFHIDSEIAILGLNTARTVVFDFSQGRINQGQISRIREVFGGLPPHLFKIVFTHHPFLPPPDAPETRLVGRHKLALPALESCGIDLLLAGHLHRAYSGDLSAFHAGVGRSILVAQASTATSTRLRAEANAYNRIVIDGATVAFEVRAWEGASFEARESIRYRRDGIRWRKDA